MSILTKIAETKKEEVARLKKERGLASLKAGAQAQAPALDFAAALHRPGKLSLIAELKKASPSKGVLRVDFQIEPLANSYAKAGAQALSVLTDVPYFQGSLTYLPLAKKVSGLPVLRKDFIVDELQVFEAREAGADAILLIAAMLTPALMKELKSLAESLGMAVLVEVHDARELEVALALQPRLLGINNRNLNDFSVTLKTTFDLLPKCPTGTIVISESGILTREDCVKVRDAGVSGVLVGEAFMTSPDVEKAVRELMP